MISDADWLTQYRPGNYPAFAVTVDLAIFTLRDGQLCVLLVQRGEHPCRGQWALPGGHVLQGRESADGAARRELIEETGIDPGDSGYHLEQLATYSEPDRDPRITAGLQVVSIAYVALAPNLPDAVAGTDAQRAQWTPIAKRPNLAFDHDSIVCDALERIRSKLEYTTLALHFVAEPFSLTDLRRVYEAVWGEAPDAANFRRKVLATTDFVRPTVHASSASGSRGGRPPELYERGGAHFITPPLTRR